MKNTYIKPRSFIIQVVNEEVIALSINGNVASQSIEGATSSSEELGATNYRSNLWGD